MLGALTSPLLALPCLLMTLLWWLYLSVVNVGLAMLPPYTSFWWPVRPIPS